MRRKKMNINLDGVYFRIERNNKWESVCYSDMTQEERDNATKNKSPEFWKALANHLANKIKEIGDEFDLIAVEKR